MRKCGIASISLQQEQVCELHFSEKKKPKGGGGGREGDSQPKTAHNLAMMRNDTYVF